MLTYEKYNKKILLCALSIFCFSLHGRVSAEETGKKTLRYVNYYPIDFAHMIPTQKLKKYRIYHYVSCVGRPDAYLSV